MTTTDSRRERNEWIDPALRTQLGVNLPGLSDDDLHKLAVEVRPELELRAGTALSDGLSDAQLAEFEHLMNNGDDEGCAAWLATNRPDNQAVVLTVRARLVADVVQAVVAADPSSAYGQRRFDETFDASTDLITHHFDSHGFKYVSDPEGGRVHIAFSETESQPPLRIGIGLSSGRGGDMFTFIANASSLTFAAESQAALEDFAAKWNRDTWMPKAVVTTDDDTGRHNIVGEIAVPAAAPVTRDYIDAMMRRCIGAMVGMFRRAQSELAGPDTGAGDDAGMREDAASLAHATRADSQTDVDSTAVTD